MKNINGFFHINLKNFTLNTTFCINQNKITAIIGESGSGKTTFLKCLSGLIEPQKGYLSINKTIIQDSKINLFIKTNKRNIGHVFQVPCLFPNMTVLENIIFGLKKNKKILININKQRLMTLLNLDKLKNRKITNLSGGEKQRVSIAQIILIQPRLILLDEAFSSQDLNMKNVLISIFKHINDRYKIPIIYVSHDIKNINTLTNTVIYLNNGKINHHK